MAAYYADAGVAGRGGEPRGGLMGKLGTLAASGTDTARWKKGLQALGSKTKEGVSSLSSATKSATAHSLSAVSHASQAASHAVSARLTHDPAGALASPAAVAALLSPGAPKAQPADAQLTVADFLDPAAPLLSPEACTRVCNALSVKPQLDSLLATLEASAGFTGGAGCDEPAAAHADWTLSPQVTGMFGEVNSAVAAAVDAELRPLLQWLPHTLPAALTDRVRPRPGPLPACAPARRLTAADGG